MGNTVEIRHAVEMKEGDGADVRRLMPLPGFMNYDPFVLWDHFDVSPGAGFPDHPHRGFEAITYVFEGSMNHKDNLGNESTVTRGGAQRFTAGKGLVHSEMPSPEGHTRGIQLWINLSKRLKTTQPSYQQVDAQDIPEQVIDRGRVCTIAGEGSPLELHTPVRYLDVSLDEGGHFRETVPEGYRGCVYIVDGKAAVNGNEVDSGDACYMDKAGELHVEANEPCRFMVCFGKPHGEPIRQHGPYVD
jgi:redox-sensitive bicupin YhaK (pirin superfamily)